MKTSSEVAAILGLSERRVRQAAVTWGVPRFGKRSFVFDDEAVERIRERIGKRGDRLS